MKPSGDKLKPAGGGAAPERANTFRYPKTNGVAQNGRLARSDTQFRKGRETVMPRTQS